MGNRLPPKNVTRWYPPRGGYISGSDNGDLTTLSGVPLVTLSGDNLVVNKNVFSPKFKTVWTKSTKNVTKWRPLGGRGYVVNQGTLNLADNQGNLLVDNSGNYIVTNPNYVQGKNVTVWTASGS